NYKKGRCRNSATSQCHSWLLAITLPSSGAHAKSPTDLALCRFCSLGVTPSETGANGLTRLRSQVRALRRPPRNFSRFLRVLAIFGVSTRHLRKPQNHPESPRCLPCHATCQTCEPGDRVHSVLRAHDGLISTPMTRRRSSLEPC